MDSTLQSIIAAVAATWLGAIGIGTISVGLKLNNAVQKLNVIVTQLSRELNVQAGEIRALHEHRLHLIERLIRLERDGRRPAHN